METAIVSIICVVLIIVGGMTMSSSFLSSVDNTTTSLNSITMRDHEIIRTNISISNVNSDVPNRMEVIVDNAGQVKFADFSKWDVIIQYYDDSWAYHTKWLPYVHGTPGVNEWTVTGIYIDAIELTPEVYEPNIFNPTEQLVIEIALSPALGSETTNQVTISTPNGVKASYIFITDKY